MLQNVLCVLALIAAGSPCFAATLEQIEVDGTPESLVLPEGVSSPDGMALGKDRKIYLNLLNLHVPAVAAIWTIDEGNQLEKLVDLPVHPETGGVFPVGIAQGADGHFYVADNQTFGQHVERKSRLLRVVMERDKPVRVETVATGFISANAVEPYRDRLYVTETTLINDVKPHVSGIYKFDLDELSAENPVQLKPDGGDPRLVAQFTTVADDWRADIGANGLAIGPRGVLYVCNFGEGSILTAPLKEDGFLAEPLKELVKGGGIGSTDGLRFVPQLKKLVVADFFSNAVHVVGPNDGRVKTIAQNANSDGSNGKLDKPSEPCIRGATLYVSNIDLPYDGNKSDKPDTLTMIQLKIADD